MSTFVQRVHSLTYNRLLRPTRTNSTLVEPDLCHLPETPDAQTSIFAIDPRARFTADPADDGRQVTSDDVRLSIERLAWANARERVPDTHLRRAADWNGTRFQEFEPHADGGHTFALISDSSVYYQQRDVVAGPFGWIASSEAIAQADIRWPRGTAGDLWTDGTGPYRAVEHGEHRTSVVRSENWWRAKETHQYWLEQRLARMNAITFVSGSANDLLEAYAAGDIDRADWPLSNRQIASLSDQFPEHNIYEIPGGRPLQLLTPRDPDPAGALSDPRVAMAINWSIDRVQIAESLTEPFVLRPSGPVPWHFQDFALPDTELHQYAGYLPSPDAVLPIVAELIEAAGGVDQIGPLKLVVSTEVSAYFADLGGLIAGMIERVTGLSVEFEQLDGAAAISRLSNGERFAYVAWGELPVSPLPIGAWSRSLHSQGAESWGAFPDAELDRLLEQLHRELNFDVLTELIAEIQRRLLSGASTGWIQNLANPVQLSIVQPWFSPDARLLDYGWSDHHLADCGIRLRSGSGYPADRRPLSGFEEAKETPQDSR